MMQCMVCRAKIPPSHVVVYDERGRPAGEVCGYHQLVDILLDSRDRFQLGITLVPEKDRMPATTLR